MLTISSCTVSKLVRFFLRHSVVTNHMVWRLVVWRSGNALCGIKEVTLRPARLVLGWVTVYGQVNHLCTMPAS